MGAHRVLIYLLRRDLRLADNPVFHEIAKLHSQSQKPFTHLLPVYVFPAQQIEVSGFVSQGQKSPYPEARSHVGNFWRCGHHRAKFLAESVWDLKKSLDKVGSGLEVRVGMLHDVVQQLMDGFKDAGTEVAGLWMTEEVGVEEKREERAVRKEVQGRGADFKLWTDEKYFVDDRDVPFRNRKECPDVFTSYKKMVEPLSEAPRRVLPAPESLPPFPPSTPQQSAPFVIPDSLSELIAALHAPLQSSLGLANPPKMPDPPASSAFPFPGGATAAHERLTHLIASGAAAHYKNTRNGLLGTDCSTKLSAWLALGSLTAREVHAALAAYESGRDETYASAPGYARGENAGTAHLRFELLWRDYMRLVARKYGPALFQADGLRRRGGGHGWKYDDAALQRCLAGRTGNGLVDASARELFLTGYTSNRARQNFASTLAKRVGLDWRLGAAWYECCLVDFDVASNWGNWAYVAGVGNDPRGGGEGRVFNPVKQSADYDPKAEYARAWVAETRGLGVEEAWQRWKVEEGRREGLGIKGEEGVEDPLFRIEYSSGRRGGGGGGGGRGGGGYGGGRGKSKKSRGSGRSGYSKAQD